MKHDSELHIPNAVADAMRALRPETRAKLSLRDIDDMTRPLRTRIAELEDERDIFKRTLDKRDAEVERLRKLLSLAHTELVMSIVFVATRQRMPPNGAKLLNEACEMIEQELTGEEEES